MESWTTIGNMTNHVVAKADVAPWRKVELPNATCDSNGWHSTGGGGDLSPEMIQAIQNIIDGSQKINDAANTLKKLGVL